MLVRLTILCGLIAWAVAATGFAILDARQEAEDAAWKEKVRHEWALVEAIKAVESGHDPDAVGRDGEAGIMQIRPIMVEDVNRILGKEWFSLEDRFDEDQSEDMFLTYSYHYTPEFDPELWARRWNGGPRGETKSATLDYWLKVKAEYEKRLR